MRPKKTFFPYASGKPEEVCIMFLSGFPLVMATSAAPVFTGAVPFIVVPRFDAAPPPPFFPLTARTRAKKDSSTLTLSFAEDSKKGQPHSLATASPSCCDTCLSWARSHLFPTSTRATRSPSLALTICSLRASEEKGSRGRLKPQQQQQQPGDVVPNL